VGAFRAAPPRAAAPVDRVDARPEGAPARGFARDGFRADRAAELERLLQPAARPRDGRQRIVRAPLPRSSPLMAGASDAPEAASPESALPPAPPKPVASKPAPPKPAPVAPLSAAPAVPAREKPPVPAPAASPHARWRLRLPDDPVPMEIVASDVLAATQIARRRLSPEVLRRVSIERVGAPAPRPPVLFDAIPPLPWVPLV